MPLLRTSSPGAAPALAVALILVACGGSDPLGGRGGVGGGASPAAGGTTGATGAATGAGTSTTGGTAGTGSTSNGTGASTSDPGTGATTGTTASGLGLTPKAACGPGSNPNTGLQGRVSRDDYNSGRLYAGYTCNAVGVGHYGTPNSSATIGGFKVERYVDKAGHECAYYDTTLLYPTNATDAQQGVNVLDMTDPARPVLTATLTTPAMLTPHESLVVAQATGVLAAVAGNPDANPGIIDLYDLSADCRSPKLKFTGGFGFLGHESGMAPDGKTFYSASPNTPTLTAVDISGAVPVPLLTSSIYSHGLNLSADGNRAYVAGGMYKGLLILDTSEIQARKTNPQIRQISSLTWPNMTIPQTAIPFTRGGKPYLLEIDEYSTDGGGPGATSAATGPSGAANGAVVGAARVIDIADETRPKVVSDLRLEVHQPENRAAIANDPGASFGAQGYAGHYCNLPTRVDPDIVACSMINSGLRVFNIHDPLHPREVAYYIAPIAQRVTPTLEASAWAMSSPSFVPARKEIWYSDGYAGFYAVRLTNGAW